MIAHVSQPRHCAAQEVRILSASQLSSSVDVIAAFDEETQKPAEEQPPTLMPVDHLQPIAAAATAAEGDAQRPTANEPMPAPLTNTTDEKESIDGATKSKSGRQASVKRIYRPITEVTTNAVPPAGLMPESRDSAPAADIPTFSDDRLAAAWSEQTLHWSASCMKHRPLYFEQVNLERYGYGCHPWLQPAVSSAHFFLTIPALPYKMTVHPPRECIYTLGYYRPGNCVPWRRNLPPWSARAGIVEATTVVGLVFLIP